MALKNLLVPYAGSDSSDAALDFGLFIRDKYDAHLTGLLAHNFAPVNQVVNNWIPDDVQKSIQKAQIQSVNDIESRFKQSVATNSAPEKIHWISKSGVGGDATVAQYARHYDLTILGRYDALHGEDQQELHPDAIAMVSGRPVLLVPRDFDKSTFNEHAVLAWDGKRASARALADALQILKTKSLVTIVTVNDDQSKDPLPGIDVEITLQRHGINTERVNL
ncbi:MAG: universal stress protein, partial [Gammaproteobacteria bacterium]|nr:universal stress protein [Gammaproteobacteria bacterium]